MKLGQSYWFSNLVVVLYSLYATSIWVLYPIVETPLSINTSELLGIIAGVVLLSVVAMDKGKRFLSLVNTHAKVYISFLLIVVSVLVSGINARKTLPVAQHSLKYAGGLIVISAFVVTLPITKVRTVVIFLLVGATVSTISSITGLFYGGTAEISVHRGIVAKGFTHNPNQYAIFLSSTFPLAYSLWINNKTKAIPFLATFLIIVGVIISNSRTNLLLVVASFLILTFLHLSKSRNSLHTLVLLGVACVLIWFGHSFFITANESLYQEVNVLIKSPLASEALHSRLDLWSKALNISKDYPLFGIGAGNTKLVLPVAHAHNIFIETLLTTGTVGLLALIIFVVAILNIVKSTFILSVRYTNKVNPITLGANVGIIVYILSNCSSDSFGGTIAILWFLISILISTKFNRTYVQKNTRCTST